VIERGLEAIRRMLQAEHPGAVIEPKTQPPKRTDSPRDTRADGERSDPCCNHGAPATAPLIITDNDDSHR
jgi:hypothetical protein